MFLGHDAALNLGCVGHGFNRVTVTTTFRVAYYYSHLTDKETEVRAATFRIHLASM